MLEVGFPTDRPIEPEGSAEASALPARPGGPGLSPLPDPFDRRSAVPGSGSTEPWIGCDRV